MVFIRTIKVVCSNLLLLMCLFISSQVGAVELITNLGGTSGFGALAMSQNDDGSSALIDVSVPLPKGINFFGSIYKNLYINNNGNVTFKAALGGFTPIPFPIAQQPMIAPFWGDVDTRSTVPGLPASSNNVYYSSAQPNSFIVTWFNVGYYSVQTNKINSFQLVMTDRSDTGEGNIDVEFRYNRLEWTTGGASGGTNGLGGTPAQVGFDAGDKINFFAHPDSRTAKVLELINSSNVGVPGIWRFEFRSGKVIEPPKNILKNVVAKLYIPATGVTVDAASFTKLPKSNTVIDTKRVIEWRYDTLSAAQIEDLSFNIVLNHPVPNEQRKVVYSLILDYVDVNNKPVHAELGEQVVNVLASQFSVVLGADKNSYPANANINFTSIINNSGSTSGNATATITLFDSSNNIVTVLPAQLIQSLAPAANLTLSASWNTVSTLNGNYHAVINVIDTASGSVATSTVNFAIDASSSNNVAPVSIRTSTDKLTYSPRDKVNIEDFIKNEASNAIISSASLSIKVISPNGTIVFEGTEALPNIAAEGYEQRFKMIDLENSIVGDYSVVASLLGVQGETLAMGHTQFSVKREILVDIQGAVIVQLPKIEKGKNQQCDFTTSNTFIDPMTELELSRSIVNLDTQVVMDAQSDVISINGISSIKKSTVASTANYPIGNYACVLELKVDGVPRNLASSLFSVIEPKIQLSGDLKIGDKGRILALIDPSTSTEEENYLKQLLTNSQRLYTLVKNSADFKAELVQGGYTTYVILSEAVTLDDVTQNLLKAQVALGDGLIVAGSVDRRNKGLEEALGIKARANESYSQGVGLQQSLIGSPWEKIFDKSSRTLGFAESGATVIGSYNNQLTGADTIKPLGYFGAASNYNVFAFNELEPLSGNVEGRVAAGGNLSFRSINIGKKVDPANLSNVVVAGGNVVYLSGLIYNGNLIAGGSIADLSSTTISKMAAGATAKGNATVPINFAAEAEYLQELSTNIAALPSTGAALLQLNKVQLNGDCSSNVQVFSLSTTELAAATGLNVNCIPAGATLIINIVGDNAVMQNLDLRALSAIREKVLFNFPQATKIKFTVPALLSIEGSVLAPSAIIEDPVINLNGQMIVKAWRSTKFSSIYVANYKFSGDLSAALSPYSKNAVAHYQYQQGKTVFMGFDVLSQALALQAKVNPNDTNLFSQFLMDALRYVQPDMSVARAGKTVSIMVDIGNVGLQSVIGQAKIQLSQQLKMISADGFTLSTDANSWDYSFNLSAANHDNKVLYIQLPSVSGDGSSVHLSLQAGAANEVVTEKNLPIITH